MRKMKDSGIEWIGEIPEEWTISKLKRFVKCYDGKRIPIDSAKRQSGVYPYWGAGSITDYVDDFLFDEELVLLGEDGAPFFDHTRPVAFFVNERIWVNNHIHVLKPYDSVDGKYLVHFLNTVDYKTYINGSILNKLTQGNMNEIAFLSPPVEEQHSIASFIDRQCLYIDNIIEKTKASIEEYKKLRQALITQAVTKGVRGDRPMKDSGIEWIGKIPEEWEELRFKYIADVKSNLVHPSEYLDYNQIAPDNIEKGTSRLIDVKTVGEVGVESDNHLFYRGQIIYSKVRPILNKVIIAPFDGLCSADMYPIETSINKSFLVYMMLSDVFLSQVKLVTENRVKMPKINKEELGAIIVCRPTDSEQQEIVEYLEKKCHEIDALITNKEELLTQLESYKKSMIYEYVTGKKEVV